MRILVVHPGPAFSVEDVYRGWCKGLRASGADVVEYDFSSRLWAWQHAHFKDAAGTWIPAMPFEEAVKVALEPVGTWIYECQPDVVMFVSGFWITDVFLNTIRARGQHVILLCTESPYEDDRQIFQAAHADTVIINDPLNIERFRAVCDDVRYVPHSYDPDVHTPEGPQAEPSDLCIVGTGYQRRVEWLERLDLDPGRTIALLGNWKSLEGHELAKWVRSDTLDHCITNDDAVGWYRAAKCSLNIYRDTQGVAMGPREIELAACGTFYLSEPRPENIEMLPMVPKVESPEDAAEQLRWWLDHTYQRHEVTVRARAAIGSWTFENRARQLLATLKIGGA